MNKSQSSNFIHTYDKIIFCFLSNIAKIPTFRNAGGKDFQRKTRNPKSKMQSMKMKFCMLTTQQCPKFFRKTMHSSPFNLEILCQSILAQMYFMLCDCVCVCARIMNAYSGRFVLRRELKPQRPSIVGR